jgi:glycosyltransferase involved in cell wall biosynthesis
MSNTPFFSVITITFNAEEFIKQTVESILSQDFNDFEYIIIDGASKDRTLEIINSYEDKFRKKGIKTSCYSEPDKGLYDAMNKGIKKASGRYIWFINAGDTIAESDVADKVFKSTNDNLPDFIYGETNIVDNEGRIMGSRRLKAPEKLDWKSFRHGMLVCHQSMIVKREIAPAFDLKYRYSSDIDWTIRALKKSESIYNTHMILSHFLDGGVSKKKMKASLKERFQIMSEYYGFLPTALRHFWFIIRAAWFKLIHGWI